MKDVLDRFKGLRYPSLVRYSKIPVGIEEEDRYQPVTLSVVRHRADHCEQWGDPVRRQLIDEFTASEPQVHEWNGAGVYFGVRLQEDDSRVAGGWASLLANR